VCSLANSSYLSRLVSLSLEQLPAKGGIKMVYRFLGILTLLVIIYACAFDLAHVSYRPTQFIPQPEPRKTLIMKEVVKINQAPCRYERTLQKDTRWDLIGSIAEGEVYKPKDQVLTVECSHVHEAYLVVSGGNLVGFYLPVEKGFVPISPTINLPSR